PGACRRDRVVDGTAQRRVGGVAAVRDDALHRRGDDLSRRTRGVRTSRTRTSGGRGRRQDGARRAEAQVDEGERAGDAVLAPLVLALVLAGLFHVADLVGRIGADGERKISGTTHVHVVTTDFVAARPEPW